MENVRLWQICGDVRMLFTGILTMLTRWNVFTFQNDYANAMLKRQADKKKRGLDQI